MKNFILIIAMLIMGLTANSLKAQGSLKLLTDPLESGIIRIYPNPNYGKFCIDLKNPPAKMRVSIYNVAGQKIYESSTISPLPVNEIDFTSHPKGVYFIKINDGETSYNETIVVQ
jgi:hypothetical protein